MAFYQAALLLEDAPRIGLQVHHRDTKCGKRGRHKAGWCILSCIPHPPKYNLLLPRICHILPPSSAIDALSTVAMATCCFCINKGHTFYMASSSSCSFARNATYRCTINTQ